QLIYEIKEPRYLTPDVSARFDTIQISQESENRVRIQGVCGEPQSDKSKVCINNLIGYRNSMTIILTGLDIEKKASILEDTIFESIGGKDKYAKWDVTLTRTEKENPATNEEAFAYLKLSVMDPDPQKTANFSSKIVELALSTIPGFTATAPPSKGTPAIMHWPALVSGNHIIQKVFINGKEIPVGHVKPDPGAAVPEPVAVKIPEAPNGKTVRAPLGKVFAARSGDKGGNANLGVLAKTPEAYAFLDRFLTTRKLKELIGDIKEYEIERYEMPNLLAVNFYINGLLGDGVAASFKSDPQAKTLGEYLRAKVVEIPESILN
ncbi:MAG: acyclic terpene utilization AtuA family protein, partial [Deltaproteobacteria bacterium]|nr:acyclic terpene utilization AtuA family protein [Deltaproteobacteria bacterium]